MDFRDSPEDAAFRAEVREFLAKEYRSDYGSDGEGRGAAQIAAREGAQAAERYKAWMKRLAASTGFSTANLFAHKAASVSRS